MLSPHELSRLIGRIAMLVAAIASVIAASKFPHGKGAGVNASAGRMR
jgi:hypothetical protein